MSVLSKIAFYQDRRDEVPNQELARELAQTQNVQDIREIAENLYNKNQNVQSDCLKVLYELGYLAPALVAGYVDDFLTLLQSKNNRLVWGGMIALATIASLRPKEIGEHLAAIQKAMEQGSVITVDNGVKILAQVVASDAGQSHVIFPYLLDHLRTCRLKDIPQHSEKIIAAVTAENKAAFIAVLEKRLDLLTASQAARVRKVIKTAEKR